MLLVLLLLFLFLIGFEWKLSLDKFLIPDYTLEVFGISKRIIVLVICSFEYIQIDFSGRTFLFVPTFIKLIVNYFISNVQLNFVFGLFHSLVELDCVIFLFLNLLLSDELNVLWCNDSRLLLETFALDKSQLKFIMRIFEQFELSDLVVICEQIFIQELLFIELTDSKQSNMILSIFFLNISVKRLYLWENLQIPASLWHVKNAVKILDTILIWFFYNIIGFKRHMVLFLYRLSWCIFRLFRFRLRLGLT